MKLLELQIDESIFNEVKDFLRILPKRKIKMREILNDSHIAYVSDKEQKDIEKTLIEKNCQTISRSKMVDILK